MKKFLTILVVLISIIGLTSCATITRGAKSEVTFESHNGETLELIITDMDGAEVFSGLTPATVTLKKQLAIGVPASYHVHAKVQGATDGIVVLLKAGRDFNVAWGAYILGDIPLSYVTAGVAPVLDLLNGSLFKWNTPQVIEGTGEISGVLEKKEGALQITAN